MSWWFGQQGYRVKVKHVRRLMRQMGLGPIYPKPRMSQLGVGHRVYPYRLRELQIERPNQVSASDIIYVRLRQGFIYLVTILDWVSRYILALEVSVSLESVLCLAALEWALKTGQPKIFNADQRAQFTSESFTGRLEASGITISVDGRGRAMDNIFLKRLWRTMRYEEVYVKKYAQVSEAVWILGDYSRF